MANSSAVPSHPDPETVVPPIPIPTEQQDVIPPSDSKSPMLSVRLPFHARLYFGFRLWTLKTLVHSLFFVFRRIKPSALRPADIQPSYTKKYPAVPQIACRVFFPPGYGPRKSKNIDGESESENTLLPLYIDVHGGGFALCDPEVDDRWCTFLSKNYGVLVVSIGYRLAPSVAFPTQVYDVSALARAVLDDTSLPYDKEKVAFGGFSAGGNLSLAAVQTEGVRGRVKGMVSFYPAVDFARNVRKKLDEKEVPTDEDLKLSLMPKDQRDTLADSGIWFNWGYVPAGTNVQDPLLSPLFADKKDLPGKGYFIGCQLDMLCREARDMVEKLAGEDDPEWESKKVVKKGGDVWESGNWKWELVRGWQHGFDQMVLKGEREAIRTKRRDELYHDVGEWLQRVVYSALTLGQPERSLGTNLQRNANRIAKRQLWTEAAHALDRHEIKEPDFKSQQNDVKPENGGAKITQGMGLLS
ncbi:hypothetical protein MMC25_006506 [Agyrium rufum]|nr:hypothetical protein [Agyrium rufum]